MGTTRHYSELAVLCTNKEEPHFTDNLAVMPGVLFKSQNARYGWLQRKNVSVHSVKMNTKSVGELSTQRYL